MPKVTRLFWRQHHPAYSVSSTPSKFQLIENFNWRINPYSYQREIPQGYVSLIDATLHFVLSHIGNDVRRFVWAVLLLQASLTIENCLICCENFSENEDFCLNVEYPIWQSSSSFGANRFLCKDTVDGRNTKYRYAFVRRAWRKPSTNFLVPQKLGYSVCALWTHTCLILPLAHRVELARKRFALPRSSKSYTKGKRIET